MSSSTIITEDNFTAVRRGEAQLAMRYVLGNVEKQPFTGQRLIAGQVAPEFDDVEAACTYFRGALDAYLRGLGAEIKAAPEVLFDAEPQPGEALAPFELLIFAGKVPASAIELGAKVSAQIIESCAELVRVLVANAVVAAAEEADVHERVVVWLRTCEFGGKVELVNGNFVGLVRVRVVVYRATRPTRSYLLGATQGDKKPSQLAWEFPMVEQIYGPNRLRWRDLRSPDYEPEPWNQPKIVVPS